MKNIKIDYTNEDGKRTSTTVNYNIVRYWHDFVKGTKTDMDEELKKVVKELSKNGGFTYKDEIEFYLLREIHKCDKGKEYLI